MPEQRPSELVIAGLQVVLAMAWSSAVLVLLFIGLLPHAGWYQTMTVLSGSMEPTFSRGDLLVVRPVAADSVKIGDVIAFTIPGTQQVETHRVVEIESRQPALIVRTKGDANNGRDPWRANLGSTEVWRVSLALPVVGKPIFWLRNPLVRWLLVLVAPACVAVLLLRRIWSSEGVPELDAHRLA